MPRDGSGQYHAPPGTDGAPDTTIDSTRYNLFIADLEQVLNTAAPIISGGTGGDTPDEALDNLGAEKKLQNVTNFDSMVWESGSFFSGAGATNPPIPGHAFSGVVYVIDNNNITVEARDQDGTVRPGALYIRQKKAGVWSGWVTETSGGGGPMGPPGPQGPPGGTFPDAPTEGALYGRQSSAWAKAVKLSGDTMTGNLQVSATDPVLSIASAVGAHGPTFLGIKGTAARWSIIFGGGDTETGGNTGSSFYLLGYSDDNLSAKYAMTGSRATGLLTVAGDPTAPLGIATKQYVDTSGREVLFADRTYYVRTDGLDTNNGLTNTAGGAFKTLQKAANVVASLDMSIYQVTVQVAAGTYSGGISLPACIGAKVPAFLGDTTTPSNVTLTHNNDLIYAQGKNVNWRFQGFRLTTTVAGANCVRVSFGGMVTIDKIDFWTSLGAHMRADSQGLIQIGYQYTAYTVSGNANGHAVTFGGSMINMPYVAVTLASAGLNVGSWVSSSVISQVRLDGQTFNPPANVSAVTGTLKYSVDSNSVIYAAGTVLPGTGISQGTGGLFM